jgi:8-oxo-dGTP pyrophosphatase MutT (NUDIX family)
VRAGLETLYLPPMSQTPLETDPRFWVLSEALASYAADAEDPPIRDADFLQAAVALVIRGNDHLEILLIKRARSERDPWSGHMALPGGRRDPGDASKEATSIRETLEEVGIDLAESGLHLGGLEELATASPRLPKLTIAPFVFGVSPETEARVASREIEAVHWVRLDALRATENQGTLEIPLPGGARSFPCYRVAGEVVWGLTYRMLSQFLEVYPDAELERMTHGSDRGGHPDA